MDHLRLGSEAIFYGTHKVMYFGTPWKPATDKFINLFRN